MNVDLNDDVRQDMLAEVLAGLCQSPKRLPSKFFYDERGSELFEQITGLREYYLTRTETHILRRNIDEISEFIGNKASVVELGSGNSQKTRLLLDHLSEVAAYFPVDISEDYLLKTVRSLKREYPELLIKPIVADYTKPFEIPEDGASHSRQVIFFPGSTIGNFEPPQARDFLRMISDIMEPDGALLVGVDLKKDPAILERAYNDGKGVTAEFNKNILRHLNREIQTDFVPDLFNHRTCYNEEKGRIEMHLVSRQDQKVHLAEKEIHISEGESIHTENSYKYSIDDFKSLVRDWFRVEKVWTDDQELFSLQCLAKG